MDEFDQAFAYVFLNEKGFVDDSVDPGGATNFGVTRDLLTRYRGAQCTVQDVKNLTESEAKAVIKWAFWDPMKLDQLKSLPIKTAILDMAVNHGEGTATKMVQRALGGHVEVDGVMGSKTITALNIALDHEFLFNFVAQIQDRYVEDVKQRPESIKFLTGWLARSRRLWLLV